MVLNLTHEERLVIKTQYDASDNMRNMLKFYRSIIPRALSCSEFWIGVALHYVLFFIGYCSTCPTPATGTGSNATTCVSVRTIYTNNSINLMDNSFAINLVIFFLVFYSSTCYARFTSLYLVVCSAGGRLHNTSLILRDYFEDPISRWQIMRYMLASHRIFFYMIRQQTAEWHGYDENSPNHPGSWDEFAGNYLIPDGLLLPEEADFLKVNPWPLHNIRLLLTPFPFPQSSSPVVSSSLPSLAAIFTQSIAHLTRHTATSFTTQNLTARTAAQHRPPASLSDPARRRPVQGYGACRHKPCLSWAATALERIIDEHEPHPQHDPRAALTGRRPVPPPARPHSPTCDPPRGARSAAQPSSETRSLPDAPLLDPPYFSLWAQSRPDPAVPDGRCEATARKQISSPLGPVPPRAGPAAAAAPQMRRGSWSWRAGWREEQAPAAAAAVVAAAARAALLATANGAGGIAGHGTPDVEGLNWVGYAPAPGPGGRSARARLLCFAGRRRRIGNAEHGAGPMVAHAHIRTCIYSTYTDLYTVAHGQSQDRLHGGPWAASYGCPLRGMPPPPAQPPWRGCTAPKGNDGDSAGVPSYIHTHIVIVHHVRWGSHRT
jgi:hypothetical protein